jgi:hypothetical protein
MFQAVIISRFSDRVSSSRHALAAQTRHIFVALLSLLLIFSQSANALPLVWCTHGDGTAALEWQHDTGSHLAAGTERISAERSAQMENASPCLDESLANAPSQVRVHRASDQPAAPQVEAVIAITLPWAELALDPPLPVDPGLREAHANTDLLALSCVRLLI